MKHTDAREPSGTGVHQAPAYVLQPDESALEIAAVQPILEYAGRGDKPFRRSKLPVAYALALAVPILFMVLMESTPRRKAAALTSETASLLGLFGSTGELITASDGWKKTLAAIALILNVAALTFITASSIYVWFY